MLNIELVKKQIIEENDWFSAYAALAALGVKPIEKFDEITKCLITTNEEYALFRECYYFRGVKVINVTLLNEGRLVISHTITTDHITDEVLSVRTRK